MEPPKKNLPDGQLLVCQYAVPRTLSLNARPRYGDYSRDIERLNSEELFKLADARLRYFARVNSEYLLLRLQLAETVIARQSIAPTK